MGALGRWAVLILGISTSTEQVSVAIGGHEGVLGRIEITRGRRHAELLVPAVDSLCRQTDVDLAEIGVVAVDIGPGLFTGMRVGIAAAKAFAHALKVPMIGISSLDLLAFPFRYGQREIIAVVDARRQQLFWAAYRAAPGGVQRLTEPRVADIDGLVAELLAREADVLCVGDGAVRHRDELGQDARCEVADLSHAHPSAGPLVELAHARALREEWVNPWELEPLYLRAPDAQINWSVREGR
jgi:tRNA threonylcarbamoyladenosine biosynthesis protein TsaB